MFSYHPGSGNSRVGEHFTEEFEVAETDDPAVIADYISRFAWSPSEFKDGHRLQENFVRANWLGLDFDSPEISLDEVQEAVIGIAHVIGTTRHHRMQKEEKGPCDRFRLLLRAEREMTADEVFATLRALARIWPIDKTCIDTARHFFPCKEIVSVGDGARQAIIPPPPPPTAQEMARQATKMRIARMRLERNGTLPRWIDGFLKEGRLIQSGGRNNTIYAVTVALTGFGMTETEISQLIADAPIDRRGLRESAVAGTIRSGMRRK